MSGLIAGGAFLAQVTVNQATHFLVMYAVAGVGIGGLVASPAALLALYTKFGSEGTAYGLDNSIAAAGRATGPILGAVIAGTFGYRSIFLLSAIALFSVVLVGLSMPEARVGPRTLSR